MTGPEGLIEYLYLDEVTRFYASENLLLIYQHFSRIERGAFREACATWLRSVAPNAALWAFTTSNVLLLIHPIILLGWQTQPLRRASDGKRGS